MRIYLPLATEDRDHLVRANTRIELPAGREAWAVTVAARADRPETDEEELEYEALLDAVHVAFQDADPTSRALVIAADVPDPALDDGSDEQGAFGVRARTRTLAAIASFHVTELDARSAEADDTEPALLWFDAAEGPAALSYLAGGQLAEESR